MHGVWANYRLGDCVLKDRDPVMCDGPPDSFSQQYAKKTHQKENYHVLNQIVPVIKPTFTIILHLRVGDVIDNGPQKVDEYWNNYTRNTSESWKKIYIYPKIYWKIIIEQLPPQTKKIGLIVGGHQGDDSKGKSADYVQRVKELFRSKGIELVDIGTGNPDQDFTQMCNAELFIPSGGGFSSTAGEIVKLRGNQILSNNGKPPQINGLSEIWWGFWIILVLVIFCAVVIIILLIPKKR